VVVRITATPVDPADGPALADEVVAVLDEVAADPAAAPPSGGCLG
jgi:hypothetical protein